MVILARLVILASNVLFALLVARALCTWLFQYRWQWVDTVYKVSAGLTEFLVAPCRKITDRFSNGMIDWSVLLACLLIVLVRDVLLRIIMMI